MLVVEILLFPRDAWLFNSPLTQAAGARHPACVCLARLPGHLLLSRE